MDIVHLMPFESPLYLSAVRLLVQIFRHGWLGPFLSSEGYLWRSLYIWHLCPTNNVFYLNLWEARPARLTSLAERASQLQAPL